MSASKQFDLNQFLATRTETVNAALDKFLPSEKTKPATIHKAMRYSLFAGGKRMRPAVLLAAAEACGGSDSVALPLACAVECIHTYSLIHDDLPAMDDDDLRRGLPTCHKKFGEALAILAGGTGTRLQPPGKLRAEAVLNRLQWPAIFARVDTIADGPCIQLMELEVIEPELFLDIVPGASSHLASTIRDHLLEVCASGSKRTVRHLE